MPRNLSKYLICLVALIVIIVLLVLLTRKENYDPNTLTKNMLDEMNTDVGIQSIRLTYCGDSGCSIGTEEKDVYQCHYQDYLDSDWSQCSATCGDTGVRTRSKRVLFDFGNNCSSTTPPTETQPCNRTPCPIDCVVGDWEPWSDCSEPCGDGVKSRTRPVVVSPQYGGAECPPLEETGVPCNNGACCVTADWSSPDEGWEGVGCEQTRTRKRVVYSYYSDLRGCPVEDIALESRNVCDISLPGGILKEGQSYSYDQVLSLLGSQTDIKLPENTKLTVTLTNNEKYIIAHQLTLPTTNKTYKLSYQEDGVIFRYIVDKENYHIFDNREPQVGERQFFWKYLSDQTITVIDDTGRDYGRLLLEQEISNPYIQILRCQYFYLNGYQYDWNEVLEINQTPYLNVSSVELFTNGEISIKASNSKIYKVILVPFDENIKFAYAMEDTVQGEGTLPKFLITE